MTGSRDDDGLPRWVRVVGVVLAVLALLALLAVLVTGGGHGPGRHLPRGGASTVPVSD